MLMPITPQLDVKASISVVALLQTNMRERSNIIEAEMQEEHTEDNLLNTSLPFRYRVFL